MVLAMRRMTGTEMARWRYRQSRSRNAMPGSSMLPRAKGTENMMPTTLRCLTLLASIATDTRRRTGKYGFRSSKKCKTVREKEEWQRI